jgi:hypothetical protein
MRFENFSMKKKIQLLILIVILVGLPIVTQNASALTQGLGNPIQVQVTPSQDWLNQQTKNNLVATYGFSLVTSCISKEPNCLSSMNQSAYSACLRFVELHLSQGIKEGCQKACPAGSYRASNGQCLAPEAGCNKEFGKDSHFTGYSSSGTPNCAPCSKGSVWSPASAACVAQKTPAQVCKEDFGSNAVWSGKQNSKGGPVCDCSEGFIWNAQGTACVTVKALVETKKPVAEDRTTGLSQTTEATAVIESAVPLAEEPEEVKIPTVDQDHAEPTESKRGIFNKVLTWFRGLFS